MRSRKHSILMKLYIDIQCNGEDFGLTSKKVLEFFEYEFSLPRASALLRRLSATGFLKRKIEKFPSGGKRYRYFLTDEGYKKAEYFIKKEKNNPLNSKVVKW